MATSLTPSARLVPRPAGSCRAMMPAGALHARPTAAAAVARRASTPPPRLAPARATADPPPAAGETEEDAPSTTGPRDDDVLPDSLLDALVQASEATHRAIQDGAGRTMVELLLPEFWDPNSGAVFAEEGDQQRFWKLTRRFADELSACSGCSRIVTLYPDAGVAAMLRNQWPDAGFEIAALGDPRARAAFSPDGGAEILILAAPDPPALAAATAAATAAAEASIPLVMFNPRLVSGDVGIGLNVRRLRESFLGSFTVTYALRPVGDAGTVFRRYPALWQVFAADPARPGRYLLAAERASPPAGEALERILEEALGGGGGKEGGGGGDDQEGPGFLSQLGSTVRSLQRFMRQLSQ